MQFIVRAVTYIVNLKEQTDWQTLKDGTDVLYFESITIPAL
jgi:phosphoribulokinase